MRFFSYGSKFQRGLKLMESIFPFLVSWLLSAQKQIFQNPFYEYVIKQLIHIFYCLFMYEIKVLLALPKQCMTSS